MLFGLPGKFKINEPNNNSFDEPSRILVPLLAFDKNNYRLGYGGGFYDRSLELLRAKRATLAIGFAYIAQECAELPLEATDQPLDMIVTEREIIEIKG